MTKYMYRRNKKHWGRHIVLWLILIIVALPAAYLGICRFLPVPGTPQMLLYHLTGRDVKNYWLEESRLPQALKTAVLASEDQKFCSHNGFDVAAVEKVLKAHDRHPHKRLRGASTISQQTARTIFLLPARSWIRKGLEAYFTVLLEAIWPKHRILTAYLNLVDWGHGNFGAEAAAEAYFHKPAAKLNALEAARLATILPDPDDWRAAHPGPYVRARSHTIAARAHSVTRDGLDMCVRRK